jgi:hypothetical protein
VSALVALANSIGIGSSVVDPDGTSIIDDWITSIKSCP